MIPAIVFDTETTGIDDAEIIEAAYLVLADRPLPNYAIRPNPDSDFEQRYKPTKPITFGAMGVHHIMDEDLLDCEPSSAFEFPDCEYVIGHKVDFDVDLVVPLTQAKRICTLALCRYLYPDVGSHTLSAMMYYLYRDTARDRLVNAHSALAYIKNTTLILMKIVEKTGAQTWEELYTISELARIPTVMAFGKWKGTPIADVPRDYVQWYLRQDDKDPYLEKAFRSRQK